LPPTRQQQMLTLLNVTNLLSKQKIIMNPLTSREDKFNNVSYLIAENLGLDREYANFSLTNDRMVISIVIHYTLNFINPIIWCHISTLHS